MRRADRLFQIIQILRRRGVTTAAKLAATLEVSPRTIYRDVMDLMASGVPIQSEPGVGYTLRNYDLPPLMFTRAEIEALVLGARIVESWADAELAQAARDMLDKVESALPESRSRLVQETALFAPESPTPEGIKINLAELRRAVRDSRKVSMEYVDANGALTKRTMRPLALSFYGPVWLVAGWCELRNDFRAFRPDRIESLSVLSETFKPEPGRTLRDFLDAIARDTSTYKTDEPQRRRARRE